MDPGYLRTLGRRPALDGLRGVAVLLVLFSHLGYGVFPGGFLGVDVFFVLSGFLITTLLLEEWGRSGDVSLPAFYRRRVHRLVPALVLLLSFAWVAEWLYPTPLASRPYGLGVLSSLGFVTNWVQVWDSSATRVLAPTWSLGVEEQFYLLWPVLLLLLLRRRYTPDRLLRVLGAVIIGCLAYVAITARLDPGHNLYVSTLTRVPELLFGCACSVLWRERRLPAALRSPLLAGLGLAGLVALGFLLQIHTSRWLYDWDGLFLAALAAGALLGTALVRPRSWIGRLLTLRPLRYTGRISYGLYLYNLPLAYLLSSEMFGGPHGLWVPVRFVAAYGVAALSYRYVESRFLGRGRAPSKLTRTSGEGRSGWTSTTLRKKRRTAKAFVTTSRRTQPS